MARLVYACQRVGRASGLRILCASAVQFSRTRGRCFRVISTIGGGSFGGHMPARREGKPAAPFYFALPPLNFPGAGGRGRAGFGGSSPLADTCQQNGRICALNRVFFCAFAAEFSRSRGGEGERVSVDRYLRLRRDWYMHASV